MKQKLLDGLQIMLVEEEALIAMDMEQLCYDNGASHVVTFGTLSSAAAHAATASVDAAILDIRLQGQWATELGHTLAARQVPFIFATSYTDAEPIFTEFPGAIIVPKPYSDTELVQALVQAARTVRSRESS